MNYPDPFEIMLNNPELQTEDVEEEEEDKKKMEWAKLMGLDLKKNEVCPKCNGQGNLYQYWYVNGGVCFKCGGSGRI